MSLRATGLQSCRDGGPACLAGGRPGRSGTQIHQRDSVGSVRPDPRPAAQAQSLAIAQICRWPSEDQVLAVERSHSAIAGSLSAPISTLTLAAD